MSTPAVVKAKRFLVNRIIDQAKRENIALSEIETRMLGFSPASTSPAERQAAAAFERSYDKDLFEARVSRLFRDVYEVDKSAGRAEIWEQSLDALALEDMYLASIIRKSGLRQEPIPWYLPSLGTLRKYLTAIIMVGAGIIVAFTPFGERLVPNPILRIFLVLCFWLTPWLLSKLAKAHGEEDVPEPGALEGNESSSPGTGPGDSVPKRPSSAA
jgi:hypothetical protein